MTYSLCCVTLLLGTANVSTAPRLDDFARSKMVPGRIAYSGYVACAEVSLGGVTQHGRIIVTHYGGIYLEHLDDQACFWITQVFREETGPAMGWDDRAPRTAPRQYVWGKTEGNVILFEIHTPDGSLKLSRHRLIAGR